jgi:hypothetical protein
MESLPVVTDDEDSTAKGDDESTTDTIATREHPDIPRGAMDPVEESENPKFELLPEDKDLRYDNPYAEFLAIHYRLGHMSPDKIRALAKKGELPKRLLTCKIPRCLACLYGKTTKRPWRTKAPVNQFSTPTADVPGKVVAIDQLILSVPGLIGQMKGFLTRK